MEIKYIQFGKQANISQQQFESEGEGEEYQIVEEEEEYGMEDEYDEQPIDNTQPQFEA